MAGRVWKAGPRDLLGPGGPAATKRNGPRNPTPRPPPRKVQNGGHLVPFPVPILTILGQHEDREPRIDIGVRGPRTPLSTPTRCGRRGKRKRRESSEEGLPCHSTASYVYSRCKDTYSSRARLRPHPEYRRSQVLDAGNELGRRFRSSHPDEPGRGARRAEYCEGGHRDFSWAYVSGPGPRDLLTPQG